MAQGGQRLDAPIQSRHQIALALAVRLALKDQRQHPAVGLALDVAADHPAGRARFAARPHTADAGQRQRAVPPAGAGLELEAVAV
jgi:hypothetical protein